MKQIEHIRYVYLIGIGGIGMSALARYFHTLGKVVSGYDLTATELTDKLVNEGIQIHFNDNIDLVPQEIRDPRNKHNILVIYTPAVPKDHSELQYFRNNDFTVKKRSEVLGWLTDQNYTLAVAGTHGKTSTTTMLAHILKQSDQDCTAFLGGIAVNYDNNLLLSSKSKNVVVEADEYDRSFLMLNPDIAIVTSMDPDHLDIYGSGQSMIDSYKQFVEKIKPDGKLVYRSGLELSNEIAYSYSLTEGDFYAEDLRIVNGQYSFHIKSPFEDIKDVQFSIPGRYNIENAIAATAAAQLSGIRPEQIRYALRSYKGVKRRFEYVIREDEMVMIDDYAHHPTELKACISAVKEFYPNKKVTAVFQPHLFSRTRDFMEEFANVLSELDELILLDIYPAREKPIAGITSTALLNKVKLDKKELCSREELPENVASKEIEVLLMLGAGDIDKLVRPVKEELIRIGK